MTKISKLGHMLSEKLSYLNRSMIGLIPSLTEQKMRLDTKGKVTTKTEN